MILKPLKEKISITIDWDILEKLRIEAENDDRLVREGERIARYYDEITQAPRKRLHNIFIFTDDDLDNEDVIAEIDVRPTYKRTRDEVKRIREKEAATTAPSPLEDGGFIINQP